jgi:hypothetical protein
MHLINPIMELLFGAVDVAMLGAVDLFGRADLTRILSYIIDEIPI